ncbi:transposase domain-containing protein [Persicobacter diffluens]|uniref:transposase domain-containing protein n=1 Tax=Persicobacter diffluens TaxID=981 RepID=UPI003B982ACA
MVPFSIRRWYRFRWWLHSENGGHWAAVFYSFFATCKLNEVNPYKWLKHTLENIRSTPEENISSLLPQNFSE